MAALAVILTIVFVLTCICLIAIILLQPHHSESGLAGAFGGGGGMDAFLGIKTVSVATKVTVVLAVVFLLLSVVLGQLPSTVSSGSSLISKDKPAAATAPAGTVTPTPAAPATAAPATGGQAQPATTQPAPTQPPAPATGGTVEPVPVSPAGR